MPDTRLIERWLPIAKLRCPDLEGESSSPI